VFCSNLVPAPKGQIGGAGLKYFYMIHRVGRNDENESDTFGPQAVKIMVHY